MRRRTDQLHAALMRAMIRLGALEAGQKRVMNIDAAPLQLVAEIVRQNLHIASQHQQIHVHFAHQPPHPRSLSPSPTRPAPPALPPHPTPSRPPPPHPPPPPPPPPPP